MSATVASEFVDGVLPFAELPRFNCGVLSSSESRVAEGAGGRDADADVAAGVPGAICGLGAVSEFPLPRFSLGRSGSSSLGEEPRGGLLDELVAVLSWLGVAWRELGVARSLPLGASAVELTEEPLEEPVDKGCDVSFIACEAATCSSSVPSRTIVSVEAWNALLTWPASIRT